MMAEITFSKCPHHSGREVASRDSLPVADIIPDATSWGGWVTIFNQAAARKISITNPTRVRTRDDARDFIRENA